MRKKRKKQKNKHIIIERNKPTVPYVLRQVESIQERARMKCLVAVEQIYPVRVLPKTQESKTIANGMELKTVSSIRKMGYTITMPREKRWELLRDIIIPKVGKDEVIRHIKFLITMNEGQLNKLGAVYEWEYDLERLMNDDKVIDNKKDSNRPNRNGHLQKDKERVI